MVILDILHLDVKFAFSPLMLLVGRQEGHPACKNKVVGCWRGYLSGVRCRLACGPADATALTVFCFSKIQIGFTFVVPADLGNPGKGPLNGCVCKISRCWCIDFSRDVDSNLWYPCICSVMVLSV